MRMSGLPVALALLAGCAAAPLRDSAVTPTPDLLAEINQATSSKVATLTLTDGRVIATPDLMVARDSSSWTDVSSGQRVTVATDRIRSIEVESRGHGAREGLGGGMVIGFIAGTVVGAVADHGPYTLITAAGGGVVGGATGLLGGTLLGGKRLYRLEPRDSVMSGAR